MHTIVPPMPSERRAPQHQASVQSDLSLFREEKVEVQSDLETSRWVADSGQAMELESPAWKKLESPAWEKSDAEEMERAFGSAHSLAIPPVCPSAP